MTALLVIAVGIRFFYLRAHIFAIDDKQDLCNNASQEGLKDEMRGNNHNITVEKHGSIISTANGDKKIVRVFYLRKIRP